MLFQSVAFIAFFAFILGVYHLLTFRQQNLFLLVCSYIFYGYSYPLHTLLLLFISTVNFSAGIMIQADATRKKLWLGIALVISLGCLAVFKYANFIVENALTAVTSFGAAPDRLLFNIILPVGISFFTFHTLTYPIDIYRGKERPDISPLLTGSWNTRATNFLRMYVDFGLFGSFFPLLLAGPIERSSTLLRQIEQPRVISSRNIQDGIWLFLIGLGLKIGIADPITVLADDRFSKLADVSWISMALGTFSFSIQIFCDFAGYTFIARGMALLMGFSLLENFRQPFFASSFSDFWKRWHITMSTWFRDYLYIPMGGNRVVPWAIYRNLFFTMVLVGLWHGAAWSFVLWGVLHGTYLALERWLFADSDGSKRSTLFGSTLANFCYAAAVFCGVQIGWFFFRIGNMQNLVEFFSTHLPFRHLGGVQNLHLDLPELLPFANFVLFLLLHEIPAYRGSKEILPSNVASSHRLALYSMAIIFILTAGGQRDQPFIYFRF